MYPGTARLGPKAASVGNVLLHLTGKMTRKNSTGFTIFVSVVGMRGKDSKPLNTAGKQSLSLGARTRVCNLASLIRPRSEYQANAGSSGGPPHAKGVCQCTNRGTAPGADAAGHFAVHHFKNHIGERVDATGALAVARFNTRTSAVIWR